MEYEHWMEKCLKCGSLTTKIICRPCFDVMKHEPEISGFLKSEEQAFIEVKGGFIAFFCNNSWVLPKVKVKVEHSRLEPTESINGFFREFLNLELKHDDKHRLYTQKHEDIVTNTYYIDCRNKDIFPILEKAFSIRGKDDIFKYYNITRIGLLRKEGNYIIPHGDKKLHIYNDISIDDSIYNAFDIKEYIEPRVIVRDVVDRYNTFYKILEPRMNIIIKNIRFNSWNVKQILHYTNILWKYKYSDPCESYYQVMTPELFKKSDIFLF